MQHRNEQTQHGGPDARAVAAGAQNGPPEQQRREEERGVLQRVGGNPSFRCLEKTRHVP
jgi:hypothetical protein